MSCPLQIFEARKSEGNSYKSVKCTTEKIEEVVLESRLSEKSEESKAVVNLLDGEFNLG